MKVMLLAAGRGERLRPLTEKIPKPLVLLAGKPLIVYHLEALARGGVEEIVINVSYLGQSIIHALGNGKAWGVKITYSREPLNQPLETGGGIFKALPLLSDPFMVINADIFTDYPYQLLPHKLRKTEEAHLVLVNNPPHHPEGDFYLQGKEIQQEKGIRLTFSGIGVYRKKLWEHAPKGRFPLMSVLQPAMVQNKVGGEHYEGQWVDIGTEDRLKKVEEVLLSKTSV